MLEPERHRNATETFFKHFSLSPMGPVTEFLREVMDRYTTIPYENLSKIIRRKAAVSEEERLRLPEELFTDYVERGLGGTCFSLSYYLMTILHNAGLSSCICMAHMGNRENVHCVVIVETPEGKYLLDPGYVVTTPVRILHDSPVFLRTTFTCIRLQYDRSRDLFQLFSGESGREKLRYRFRDMPVNPEEFIVHWQRSFEMETLNNICISLRRGDTLVYLHGNYYRENRIDGFRKKRIKDDLYGTIQRVAGVRGGIVEEAMGALRKQRRTQEQGDGT